MIPIVVVQRISNLVTDAEVEAAVAAIQKQVSGEFAAAWRIEATIVALGPADTIPTGAWPVKLVDTLPDVDNALGYHFDESTPSGFVGIKTSLDDGVPWQSVLAHEVLELLVDPWASLAAQVGATFYALEVCDATEGAPYLIDGVPVENFVYPDWFRAESKGPWDEKGVLTAPLTLAPGGYSSVFSGGSWTQNNAERVRAFKRAPHPLSRRGRRIARSRSRS